MIATIGVLEALVLAGVGALHFYWAAGGHRVRLAAVPEMEDRPVISPGPLGCVAVGVSPFCAAALVCWAAGVGLPPGIPKRAARCLLLGLGAAAIVVS